MKHTTVRARTLAVAALAALAALAAGCLPGPQPPTRPPRPSAATVLDLPDADLARLRAGLHGLGAGGAGSDAPLVRPEQGDCAVTPMTLPGQEYRFAGGGSPFAAVDASGGPIDPSLVATPATVAAQLRAGPAFAPPQADVGLVILDDFGGGPLRIDANALTQQLRAVLAGLPPNATTEQRQQALATRADQLVAQHAVSHGGLVLEHTLALLDALGAQLTASDDRSGRYVAVLPGGKGRIVVQAHDLGPDARMADVAAALRSVTDALAREVSGVVVNMSFGAVPCDISADFALNRSRYPTFADYAQAVADVAANGAALERFFQLALRPDERLDLTRALLVRPVAQDPLASATREGLPADVPVVLVASSGNYGLTYPLFPAAWPAVVAVGARDAVSAPLDPLSVSAFSDGAEVVAGGAYFTLAGLRDPTSAAALPAVVYAGTSFAAPAVALLSAVDLGAASPRCGRGPGGLPRLHGPIDDSAIELAVDARCLP